ncbi:MAG: glycosyltransferase [Actinomycetota bacterium]|nr:glycosyltransferase [Actinomycetota bacterium]
MVIPCHNEERTIADVVRGFAQVLPEAQLFVYDNSCTDATSQQAQSAGAVVRREPRLGKGNVVRRMFADVDADVYVVVDGDGTYDPGAARTMVDLLLDERLDMVVGCRAPAPDDDRVYRKGHAFGNAAFTRILRVVFGGDFTDVFSGYRVISRRLAKSFPAQSAGFEIETELSVHAVQLAAPCAEVATTYRSRQGDSNSKLRTGRDGVRILFTALGLFRHMRPLQFFGSLFVLLTALAVALGIPVVDEYVRTGLVARFPTAILAAAIQTVAFICLSSGLVLDNVVGARKEARRLAYLQIPPVDRM